MARILRRRLPIFYFAATVCTSLSLPATGADRVGNAAAVRGVVQLAAITGVREVGKKVASGEPIFLGDRVTTGAEGRLQIMLLDQTVFTIGPKAVIVIDEFVYDPNTSQGKVAASVLKGTFRFVTGKVSKRDPSKMVVKLPVGSIGVRGTSVAGQTDGFSAEVVLLGPGPNTNTGERVGSITVTGLGTAIASRPVDIVRPGFATRINAINQAPTQPVRMDPGRLRAITGQLNGRTPAARPTGVQAGAPPPPNGPLPDGRSLVGQSGDQLASGAEGIKIFDEFGENAKDGQGETQKIAQFFPPLGPDTTFEQLRTIKSGTANFGSQTRPLLGGGTGNYTISYSYNFATQSAIGNITVNSISLFSQIGIDSVPLIANPFASGTGKVNLTEAPIAFGGALAGATVDVNYKFRNADNVIFKALDHVVTFNSGLTGTGSGKLVRP